MKTTIKIFACFFCLTLISMSGCRKDKKTEAPSTPPEDPSAQEVVTTLRIYIWDSITGVAIAGSPFSFKDPDGDGGQSGAFLNNGQDSVISLLANASYKTRLVILDETKSPVDSTSKEIGGDEGYEHMVFYNGDPANGGNTNGNAVIKSGYPDYKVKLNGSNITLRYTDTDNGIAKGKAARNIGLETLLKTSSATVAKFPFIITLRHQPDDGKDGTYAPGETDVEVRFKVRVN